MRIKLVKPIKITSFVVNWFLTGEPLKILARLSFLVSALVIANAQAVECETMQFLKNKSQGVSIQNNLCEADDKVSVGSSFTLIPGGRLWLKAQVADSTDFQLICQNRAARVVEVKFSNTVLPWITPTGFAQCSNWKNNKLSCADDSKAKNDFICAIAAIKPLEYLKVTNLERTTSVKMRTINSDKKKTKIDELAKPELSYAVIATIRSEVSLCRDLYHVEGTVKVSWTLDVLGRIEKLLFANADHFEQQFRSCVASVINNFAYPKFKEHVAFSQEL